MFLSKERPRFWPFVIIAALGLAILVAVGVMAMCGSSDPPAVELLK
jgi:hypothetical protein